MPLNILPSKSQPKPRKDRKQDDKKRHSGARPQR
jgi:hypothetical protein